MNLADAGIIARLRGSAKALKADIGADLLEVPVGPSQRQHYVLPLPLCWLARYSQVIAFAAALLAGLPGKNSATPAMFARDWQIFKFIVAHDFIPTNWLTTLSRLARIVIGLKSAILAPFGATQLPRNGAVASAVLVHSRVDRPTSTGTGGNDPLWHSWRGTPACDPSETLRRIRRFL